MARPPQRPPSALDEVERAISVLAGRHPEHEKTRRETVAAAGQRKKWLDRELADSARRRRRRVFVFIASAIALGIVGAVAWTVVMRSSRIRGALARDEAHLLSLGAEELASNQLTAGRVLEVDAPPSSCLFALATDGKVIVHAGATTLTGGASVGFCSCAGGRVTIEAPGAGGGQAGLALLRLDSKIEGGTLARPWSRAAPEVWGDDGAECAESMLDAWIADHRWPRPALRGDELAALPGAAMLRADGFRVATRIAEGTPFAVVETAAGDCDLAIAPGGELSLRRSGGARPIDHAQGAMAWCGSRPDTVSVWATGGASRALVLSVPAGRLGGLLGAREAARDAGYPLADGAAFLRADDQAWEATAILRASTLTDIVAGPLPPEPGAPDARAAAIVAAGAAGVTWEETHPVACDPPLNAAGALAESVCAPAAAAALWRKGVAAGSAARGALPLWMSPLTRRPEADAAARVPELLSLARQLTREGFEPTTFEGVTETKDGVRVVGRAGEDAVVAVGLAPRPPWIFPYSDGVPWDLGDAPREVALRPGDAVSLRATPMPGVPIDKRRTVVFRRAARP